MMKKKILLNNSGFSITEALVSSVIVVISAVFMGTVYFNYFRSASEFRIETAFNEIESVIISSLQDENVLLPYRANLVQGIVSSNMVIRTLDNTTIAQVNNTTYVDEDLTPGRCAGGFDPVKCFIKVDFNIRCLPQADGFIDCGAAYKIQVDPRANHIKFLRQISTIKNTAQTNTFSSVDYTVPISFHNFLRAQSKTCKVDPAAPSIIPFAVTGMNRKTGEVYCADLPTNPSAPNLIPIGLKFTQQGLHGGKFDVVTSTGRSFTCPVNYSLNTFSTAEFDTRVPLSAQCIFVGKDMQPWGDARTGTPLFIQGTSPISGLMCPSHYRTAQLKCDQTLLAPPTQGSCRAWTGKMVPYVPTPRNPPFTYWEPHFSYIDYTVPAPPISPSGYATSEVQSAKCVEVIPPFNCPDPNDDVITIPTYRINLRMEGWCKLDDAKYVPASPY